MAYGADQGGSCRVCLTGWSVDEETVLITKITKKVRSGALGLALWI